MVNTYKKTTSKILEVIHRMVFHDEMGENMKIFLRRLSVVFWGSAISSSILYLLNMIGGKTLGLEEYGKFQLVVTVSQFLSIPMVFGLQTAGVKYISSEEKKNKKEIVVSTIILSYLAVLTITTILFVVFRGIFQDLLGVNGQIFISSIIFSVFLSSYILFRSITQGMMRMNTLSLLDIAYSITILISFFLLKNNFDVSGYRILFVSYTAGYFLYCLLFFASTRLTITSFDRKIFVKIIKYCLFTILGSTIGLFYGNVDRLILNRYFSVDNVGLYSAYYVASVMVISQLMQMVTTVFFPTVSSMNDKRKLVKKINRLSAVIFAVSAIVCFPIIYFSLTVMGGSYPIVWSYLIIFSLNSGVIASYQLKMWFINSIGISGVRQTIKGTLSFGVVNFVLCLILIPRYSILGASLSLLVTNIFLYLYFSKTINNTSTS